MNLISMMMIFMSILLLMSSHPVAILAIILVQTLLLCVFLWSTLKTSWFSFILFLIFLGGLMVLFVYIVSLASNEKFEANLENIMPAALLITATTTFLILPLTFQKSSSMNQTNFFDQTYMIFSSNLVIPTSLVMFYLLFSLIVAIKISSKYEGPLRNFIK